MPSRSRCRDLEHGFSRPLAAGTAYVVIVVIAARTCAADHTPPRGAEIPRPFNSFAIERNEFAPALRISSITGARSAARAFAASDLTLRALAQSAAVPTRPLNPPSRLPRAFAAARAARVRSEISFASCSAMAAMMWMVRRFAQTDQKLAEALKPELNT
jgi:hypothetical protein